jgi:hypothetical protein
VRNAFGVAFLVLFAGCATVTGPGRPVVVAGRINRDTTRDFVVTIQQKNAAVETPQNAPIASSAPGIEKATIQPPVNIEYAISIKNRTEDPMTVRHITLEYRDRVNRTAGRRTRDYSTTIAPGATETLNFWFEIHSDAEGTMPSTPGFLPAEIEFEGPHGKRLESFVTPVSRRHA